VGEAVLPAVVEGKLPVAVEDSLLPAVVEGNFLAAVEDTLPTAVEGLATVDAVAYTADQEAPVLAVNLDAGGVFHRPKVLFAFLSAGDPSHRCRSFWTVARKACACSAYQRRGRDNVSQIYRHPRSRVPVRVVSTVKVRCAS
jgi:hypothetical protein